jgi:hypothetical protein
VHAPQCGHNGGQIVLRVGAGLQDQGHAKANRLPDALEKGHGDGEEGDMGREEVREGGVGRRGGERGVHTRTWDTQVRGRSGEYYEKRH